MFIPFSVTKLEIIMPKKRSSRIFYKRYEELSRQQKWKRRKICEKDKQCQNEPNLENSMSSSLSNKSVGCVPNFVENETTSSCDESVSCVSTSADSSVNNLTSSSDESASCSSISTDTSNEGCDFIETTSFHPNEKVDSPSAQISENVTMRQAIINWVILEKNVPNSAVTRLLHQLRNVNNSLPCSYKTLLPPPRLQYETMAGGSYVHLSNWKKGLQDILSSNVNHQTVYHLIINIDGLPLFKSSPNYKLYPILISLYKVPMRPLCAGIYCSEQSPNREMPSADVFLKALMDDLRFLENTPATTKGLSYHLANRGIFVCDAPARSSLKAIKSHTGYNSCERCTVHGKYIEGRVCFVNTNCIRRSDVDFVLQSDPEHHKGHSALTDFGVGMVSHFVLDYMHLSCLGVTKRLMTWWKGVRRQRKAKLSSDAIARISMKVVQMKPFIPMEFNRKLRPVSDLPYWKASEYRLFMLYVGCVMLHDENVLSKSRYFHFLKLTVAMRFLLYQNTSPQHLQVCSNLLREFVSESATLYGKSFVSYNVHSLLHLVDDYVLYGSLDNVNSFPFESYLGVLKNCVKSGFKPLQQVAKHAFHDNENCLFTSKCLRSNITCELTPCVETGVITPQFERSCLLHFSDVKLPHSNCSIKRNSIADSTICISSTVYRVFNIIQCESGMYFIVKRYKNTNAFFTNPVSSNLVGIYEIMKTFKRFVCVKFSGGTNDVVPRSWLCDEGKLCKWPTNSSVDIAIMRKQEFPPQKNWKLFKCTVLCQSSLYEKCCRIAYTTQQCSTSELSSEPDEESSENARSSFVRTNDESVFIRPGKPMQKTVAVNCGDANPNSSTTELLQKLSKDMASGFDVISQQLHALKSILDKPGLSQCGHQSTYQAPVLPKRSETMEELHKSLQDLHVSFTDTFGEII
ncbi:unnamed protein product [Clavelina lepadiformis]|uniref:Transposase domain-containing protein n=1 Tax=Clavelina lepadiformis TaxID=159417 RepID=A0ABP0H1J4_CLALP